MAKKSRSARAQAIMEAFSSRLRKAREAHYESAEQFAIALGKSAHAYRHYERGDAEPDFETLERICSLLRVTPNDLLPGAAKAGSRAVGETPFRKAVGQ
jgi:transcriptional regulator with XRE-family HTH domain